MKSIKQQQQKNLKDEKCSMSYDKFVNLDRDQPILCITLLKPTVQSSPYRNFNSHIYKTLYTLSCHFLTDSTRGKPKPCTWF